MNGVNPLQCIIIENMKILCSPPYGFDSFCAREILLLVSRPIRVNPISKCMRLVGIVGYFYVSTRTKWFTLMFGNQNPLRKNKT
jgi:hypothetical protein